MRKQCWDSNSRVFSICIFFPKNIFFFYKLPQLHNFVQQSITQREETQCRGYFISRLLAHLSEENSAHKKNNSTVLPLKWNPSNRVKTQKVD